MIRNLYQPMLDPRDVVRHLAKGNSHWRAGYSAQELAYSWFNAEGGFPPAVRCVLSKSPEYVGATFVDGFFERLTKLDTSVRPSQADLMVISSLKNKLAILAVEGKVEESFDKVVEKWNDSTGKQRRLEFLCKSLRLDCSKVQRLRYQLFHRVYSALAEAKRYRRRNAMLLVHSFSKSKTGFEDFAAFADALGIPVKDTDTCSDSKIIDDVSLRLAWVCDQARSIP